MTRYIDPDLKDFLRREDSYAEYAVEVTAPDVGQVLRRATDQFFTAPPLVSPSPLTAMTQAPAGGLQLAPTAGTLATTAGANTTTYALNQESSVTRMKGLLWTVDPAFARAVLRSVQATVVRTGVFKNVPTDFQLQIYRVTKTPGAVEKYDSTKKTYSATAFTDYAFTPLLSTAAVKKAANIVWAADVATINFDLSQFGLALENTPTPAAAADQVGELPLYFFVVSALNPPAQNTFFWQLDTSGQKAVPNVGTFARSWWDRSGSDAQWNRTDYADCPSFTLSIDTYAANAQAVYLIDLGRVPTAGTTGRIVFERKLPTGTSATLELSTAGSAGPWTTVKSGDVVATAQQQYWLRLTLASDAAGRSSSVALGWGVEFRTPYDVSDIAITQLPTRDVAPPDCKASIAEAAVRLIREGQRDFLDLATMLGSSTPTSKLEVDVYLRSRHPLVFGDRSKWLRLERLAVDDRDPGKTSEAFTLLSIAKKLKVTIPAKVESVNTVHTVQAGTTATAVQVTPALVGTSAGGHEYNGLGYYLRVRSSAALPAGFSPTIAGSSGTNELDFNAGAFPVALNVGDVVEVHSGLLTTSPLKWQDADPADVWSDILTAAGFPPERIGSADLPRSGLPPRVTDFAPGDATTQGKRKVTMQLTDAESADELLDQISFIMGGATVERNGQMCFVQIYPGRALDGTVTVPVAPVAAVFDARDLVTGSLRTKPMVASRKATVTAKYGVNKAAANPDAYPERVTNATDADAVEWLTQQDLETVGSMDLDDKITRWFYNTADAGLFLASAVCSQVVRACSTGIRNFPFRVREPYPEVTIGDSVVVITEQYTDYDPSLATAISGTVALKGVVVHTGAGGRDFSIFVLGLSDNVQRLAGGAAGDNSATDMPPATPAVQIGFSATGGVSINMQGAPGTLSMKVAISTTGTPSDAAVEATTAIAGDQFSGFITGTVAFGQTVYVKAFAYSRAGGAGARSIAATPSAPRQSVTNLDDVPDGSAMRRTGVGYVDAAHRVVNAFRTAGGHDVSIDTLGAAIGLGSDELVVNGGGQDGVAQTTPGSSTATGWTAGVGAPLYATTDDAKVGDRSLAITHGGTPPSRSYASQDITVSGGVPVLVKGWVKYSGSETATTDGVFLEVDSVGAGALSLLDYSAPWANYIGSTSVQLGASYSAGAVWSYVEMLIVPASSGTLRLFACHGNGSAARGGTARFDGVSCKRQPVNAITGGYRGSQALDSNYRLVDQRRIPMTNVGGARAQLFLSGTQTPADGALSSSDNQITIPNLTLYVGDGSPISYAGTTITGTASAGGTMNWVYFTDPTYSGSGSFVAVTNPIQLVNNLNRVYVGKILCVSSSSGTGSTCPAPETRILLADGTERAAGELRVGDVVATRHEESLEAGVWPVTHVSVHTADRWRLELADGRVLIATRNHRVYVWGHGWTRLDALKPAGVVMGEQPATVVSVHPLDRGPVVKITVDGAHTYMSAGLLSHNQKPV